MRISDSRYARERSQLELAMRMIAYEARTCTIKTCTGLSDDRIRRIYSTYFKAEPNLRVRRQRGKSPSRISVYVKNAPLQCESTSLGLLFASAGLIRLQADGAVELLVARNTVEFGQRFCRAYGMYCLLHRGRRISFERAWFLLEALVRGDELMLQRCGSCAALYVHDALSLAARACPCCVLRQNGARSPRH